MFFTRQTFFFTLFHKLKKHFEKKFGLICLSGISYEKTSGPIFMKFGGRVQEIKIQQMVVKLA